MSALNRMTKNKSGKGLRKFLGELELAIMEIVWNQQPISVSEVLTILNTQQRKLAYTSVMTVMSRLVEKGWLKTEKRGRAYIYQALQSRQEAEARAVGEVVHALLNDFGEIAVAQFIKELDEISPDTLARLAALSREAETNNDEKA
ncbi:MAG: BlaI/MecI/CopY family transcriptional regulator [Chloroflexi bacterium]|nr:BlaI/MecI/CopY family transcriptional regulator [Chloroflexota bacterium]